MCFLEEIKMKQNLMRLLARNRGRGQFEIKAAADGKEATVYLYDAIVATEEEAEWYGGVSAQSFVKQLAGLEADTIHLRINSPGGSVFAGRAMETALRQHSAKVIVYVDGLAASAASFVAMAGDEIEMAQGAFFMIHKAWSMAWGNSDELRKEADLLDKVDGSLAKTYHDRTGLPEAELAEMMAAETWLDADEAVAKGFADRVAESNAAQNRWDLSAYQNAPAAPAADHPPAPAAKGAPPAEPEPQPDRAALARAAQVAILGGGAA